MYFINFFAYCGIGVVSLSIHQIKFLHGYEKKLMHLHNIRLCHVEDFSKNVQTSFAPPLGLDATLCCLLWGPAWGDWDPDHDWDDDWDLKSSLSNPIITSGLTSESGELLVDGREITGFSPAAPSGVGYGGCVWTGIGTGPWHCLAQGVNRTVAAAWFWEHWIWWEAKDVGERGAGIMVALGVTIQDQHMISYPFSSLFHTFDSCCCATCLCNMIMLPRLQWMTHLLHINYMTHSCCVCTAFLFSLYKPNVTQE